MRKNLTLPSHLTTARLSLEHLEARECPAVLDVTSGVLTFTGDGSNDNVTVSISGSTYTVTNSASVFSSVPSGWTGIGTNTSTGPDSSVSSIVLDGGDGNDIINIRSTNDPLAVADGNGNDTTNISTNAPSNTGTLDGINATVSVSGGTDTDNLVMSDYSAASGDGAVSVASGSVTGLAPVSISFAGTFAKVRVITSNTPGLSETVTVNGTSSPTQVDTYSGNDTVFVLAVSNPLTLNTGAGADTITIGNSGSLSGILAALNIDAGAGANTLTLDDSAGGSHAVTLTNTQIQDFAPALVKYKALGGTLTLNLVCSDDVESTIDIGPLSTRTTLNLIGDWVEV